MKRTSLLHVHPQRFLQRIVLSDGSQIETTTLAYNRPFIVLVQDSMNHPSWNPSRLVHQRLVLDSYGAVSSFAKKFGSTTSWKDMEDMFSSLDIRNTNKSS